MRYRSFNDLALSCRSLATRLPRDIDVFVGIPRSGMLAASILGLLRNTRVADLRSFLQGSSFYVGSTRAFLGPESPANARKVALIDDSVASGGSFGAALSELRSARPELEVYSACVYAEEEWRGRIDYVGEYVSMPRIFEWNLYHHPLLRKCALDIDGILCIDPSRTENDDGPRYRKFLRTARPLNIPTVRVGALVTSRLEKYRSDTEYWLSKSGVTYDELIMLDLPSAAERRRQAAHAGFKASYYKQSNHILFIESEETQAEEIWGLARKPVLCPPLAFFESDNQGGSRGFEMNGGRARNIYAGALSRVKGLVKRQLGAGYSFRSDEI